jgi:hypothetical protein
MKTSIPTKLYGLIKKDIVTFQPPVDEVETSKYYFDE